MILEGKTKVFVIGLDGATFDVIMPWMKAGSLPNLAGLASNGISGELITAFPPLTPVAWASFMTGKNPGKHGIFDFGLNIEGSHQRTIVSRELIDGDSLWKILSQSGKTVGIIGIPLTYPPEKINGFIIPGFLSPSYMVSTHPPNLVKDLEREIDGFSRMYEYPKYLDGAEHSFLKKWHSITEATAQTTFYLMDRYNCDFFMTYFLITDQIQHFFWKYMDSQHPAYDEQKAKKYGNAVLEAYRQVDSIIGKILRKVDDKNTTVIVMSDHGFGLVYRDVFINQYLEKLGFLKLIRKEKHGFTRRLISRAGLTQERFLDLLERSGASKLIGAIPYNFALKFYWGLPTSRQGLEDIDYSQTKAFSAGYVGQIFINFKRNESEQVIECEEKYEEFRDHLIKRLYELTDPETNERIVDKVFKREEMYQGPKVKYAADLLFTMKNMTYITRGSYEFSATGSLTGPPSNMESGWHRMNGLLIIRGSNIKRGETIVNAKIMDLAPTILHIMDVPIPQDMDGKVIKKIFKQKSEHVEKEIKYRVSIRRKEKKQVFLSKEEEDAIKERLKALGYLG